MYLEIQRAIYRLPQAGILAIRKFHQKLFPAGYYEVAHTPGLWRHVTQPVQFTLFVDIFGIRYEGKTHLDHLIDTIKKTGYNVAVDESGSLYFRTTLKWNSRQ